MRIITKVLQSLAVVVLLLAVVLLVMDPRLRNIVVEDLSLVNLWAKSSEGEATPSEGPSQSGKTERLTYYHRKWLHDCIGVCALAR